MRITTHFYPGFALLSGDKFIVEIKKSLIDELIIFSTLDKQQDVKKYVTQKSPDKSDGIQV